MLPLFGCISLNQYLGMTVYLVAYSFRNRVGGEF